ncbi:fatty acid-binding protein, liver-like [Babylonia areolata]|uniref:fatty acid-binding protein, liver-like n=1 Tax=Babylonia areolata TaxID=304850 RepID=UPI003FCF91C3
MAEAFLGVWQVDPLTITGLDKFGAAMGIPAERIEMFRTLLYTIELSVAGDTYTGVVTFDTDLVPVQKYPFQLGQAFEFSYALDGSKPQLTVTLEGGRFVERYRLDDKEWVTVREVNDNVMTATTTFNGVTATQTLNRV